MTSQHFSLYNSITFISISIASIPVPATQVFSALGGWLLLGQNLSMRESAGCTLIFAAVVLSQLPFAELRRCKKGA